MALIYKSGQGYWTRMLTAIGVGTIVLAGVGFFWGRFDAWFPENTLYWQAGMAAGTVLGFGALVFWILNKPNIVDFMIATEAEMKKVNWPSKKEIYGSTVVVISGTLMMAVLLTAIDFGFGLLFTKMGILAPVAAGG